MKTIILDSPVRTETNNEITVSVKHLRVIMLCLFVLGLIAGLLAGHSFGQFVSTPSIPRCTNALDVIVGNGEYNPQTGYWSEYNCVSDWRDAARRSISRGGR